MAETVQARRQAAAAILAGKPVPAETVDILTQVLADLVEVGGREAQASLDVAEDQAIALDLTEETRQLENDVVYLEQGREALMTFKVDSTLNQIKLDAANNSLTIDSVRDRKSVV